MRFGSQLLRWRARLTDALLLKHEGLYRTMGEFSLAPSLLCDWSGVTDFRVTGNGLYALAVETQHYSNLVAIVTRSGFMYGMAKLYQLMANWKFTRVNVFLDNSAALGWLGVEIHSP
jgi:hypothetical protein